MTATAENTCIDGAQESIAIAKRVRTRTRTRTGCWNCRRKRRKCDERRPICSNCLLKNESCHRGLKLSFRPENLQTLPSDHPSMRPPCGPGSTHISRIEIFDVTHEVIRDYWNEVRILAIECNNSSPSTETVGRRAVSYLSLPLEDSSAAVIEPDDTQTISDLGADDGCPLPSFMLPMDTHDRPVCGIPLRSYEEAPSGAANLVDFSRSEQANPTLTRRLTPHSSFNDGIFLPGSAYLELHSTLRSHMFDSARSIAPTRQHSPEYQAVPDETQENTPGNASFFAPREQASLISSLAPTPGMVELAQQEEYELWKNWTDEIGPWVGWSPKAEATAR
ncbi:hypothetical protein BLS_003978 [Venturia inaequalis]|uniref:Zn(2)-C6 fungal-type domain-containing protein n=1 Tax=Venturia inaequalis TaxID=5025 RepID=A0A8H3YUL4_VENIN|nr:hypothetical protein BLS_003978 [Venturia inaequalis]